MMPQSSTTSAHVLVVDDDRAMCQLLVDLLRDGKLRPTGFVRQEDATLADFLMNRFGRAYA